MKFSNINLQNLNYDNFSSLIVIVVLLSLFTLLLVYMILNVNNKMNSFMKIYDQEQDKQEKDLEKKLKKINESNKNIKNLINSKKKDLNINDKILNDLGSRITENEKKIEKDKNLINNLHDISFGRNLENTGINIGSNNQLTIGDDGSIIANLDDERNFKICDKNGDNCSRVITRKYIDENLSIWKIDSS